MNLSVEEIVVRDGLRARVHGGPAERRSALVWVAAVAAALFVAVMLARAHHNRPVVAAPATSPASESPHPRATPTLYVHVAGAVRQPGLYRFHDGMRVADAIEAAGGPLPKADVDAINLADLLTDRLKIEVPMRGKPTVTAPAASASPGLIDLNTADQAMLETIPGIGPVTATAILQHRTEVGTFDSIEQLLDVTGIGPATLEALRPYVTV